MLKIVGTTLSQLSKYPFDSQIVAKFQFFRFWTICCPFLTKSVPFLAVFYRVLIFSENLYKSNKSLVLDGFK